MRFWFARMMDAYGLYAATVSLNRRRLCIRTQRFCRCLPDYKRGLESWFLMKKSTRSAGSLQLAAKQT